MVFLRKDVYTKEDAQALKALVKDGALPTDKSHELGILWRCIVAQLVLNCSIVWYNWCSIHTG